MRLRVLINLILMTAFAGCCAAGRPTMPADEDPGQLAAAIARRGDGGPPVHAEGPGSYVLADVLNTGGEVCGFCSVLAVQMVYAVAKSGI